MQFRNLTPGVKWILVVIALITAGVLLKTFVQEAEADERLATGDAVSEETNLCNEARLLVNTFASRLRQIDVQLEVAREDDNREAEAHALRSQASAEASLRDAQQHAVRACRLQST